MGANSFISLVGGVILALILGGYFGHPYLPAPKPLVFAIDLGTTYSSAAVFLPGQGIVEVISVQKASSIPSVVAVTKKTVLVGYPALQQIEKNPRYTFYDAKRFIGKKISKDEFDIIRSRYLFDMDILESSIQFKLPSINPLDAMKEYMSPQEMSSIIIDELKSSVQEYLQLTNLNKVVLALPAEFDAEQREATIAAANLSKLNVLAVISEPTAAALAYGLDKQSKVGSIIVIDLGGGTLDVSLLEKRAATFYTVAIAGNNHLGGQDFTDRLSRFVLSKIEDRELSSEVLQEIKRESELVKLILTNKTTAEFQLNTDGVKLRFEISRKEFEKMNEDLFDKITEPISVVLDFAEITTEAVDEVILVGGSTRIPRVRELISYYFKGKRLDISVDPELAVVKGVALHAGVVSGSWPLRVAAIDVPTSVKKIEI
ncbi:Heat shock 70 kDa protein 13-like [Oopsacas minuta]|uniref:Heat shock 70 kDa protein 13-like n=1 Tax=Oopsacas minuta TaxID=111878 RepID=A0AAV7K1W0_9METZ|nr:Heat shock 70 kDa protein 13-like [Oopsacas minuta]